MERKIELKIFIKENSNAAELKKFRSVVKSNDAARKMEAISAKYEKDFL